MKMDIWKTLCILLLLIICTYTDIKSREISMKVLFGFGTAEMLLLLLEMMETNFFFPTGIFVGVVMWIISRFTKGAIGEGDALLLILTGILLGMEECLVLLTIAASVAAICGMLLLIFKKARKKEEFPFVPFILISYIGMIVL